MDKPSRRIRVRRWLATMAFGVLLVLAIAPETGWMVRRQLANVAAALILCPRLVKDTDEQSAQYKERVREIGALHPADLPVQCAVARVLAFTTASSDEQDAHSSEVYEPLTARFGTLPSLHANILRISTFREVMVQRPEVEILEGGAFKPPPPLPDTNRPEAIQRFLDHATAGEHLDPENAYFP